MSINSENVEYLPQNFPVLKNDNILRAAKGEPVDRIPIWIMRQAGRFLPEFLEFRKKHDFFKICQTPELACEVTLFPIKRFDLDAAIIFSDILVVPQALGLEVEMRPGEGPVFLDPLKEPKDLSRLNLENVLSRLEYVGKAITLTRHRLDGKVPLIGFSGGPWTLMAYMIDGSSKTYSLARKWIYKYPEASKKLLNILTDTIIDYLTLQIESGAQLLQLFESNMEYLNLELFKQWSEPYLRRIPIEVSKRLAANGYNMVPIILFCKGGHFSLADQSKLGYNVLGIDWTVEPKVARQLCGINITLQGNLDPSALQDEDNERFVIRIKDMVERFVVDKKLKYIANLGHGIYPDSPIDKVQLFIDTIHSL